MIWKYDTEKIEGKHYLCGVRLLSEVGTGDNILILTTAPEFGRDGKEELRDTHGQPAWEVVEDTSDNERKLRFIYNPLPPIVQIARVSIEELALAVIELKTGDDTRLNDIEQKLNDIKAEGI